MSLETVQVCSQDYELRQRVEAGLAKEVWANPTFGDTPLGQDIKVKGPAQAALTFMWPISIDNEADYQYALDTGNAHPGRDPGVIGDDEIQAGIQAHWAEFQVPTGP